MRRIPIEMIVEAANVSADKSSAARFTSTGERGNQKSHLAHVIGFQSGVDYAHNLILGADEWGAGPVPVNELTLRETLRRIAYCTDDSTLEGIKLFARKALNPNYKEGEL